jgi:integrase
VNLQLEQLTVARNISLSLKGYFEADEDLKTRKQQNKQKMSIVTVPISQNILQGEIDIMKNITLRADGRYMGRKQVNGYRVTVYATTAKQCVEKLKKAIKYAKQNPKTKKVIYRLYDWLDNWYDTYKAPFVQYKSALQIEAVIKTIKANFDNLSLHELTPNIIQTILNKFPATRQKEIIVLYFNASMQKAEDLNIIEKNPFKAIVRDRKINNKREPFNLRQQQIILNAIKGTDIEAIIYLYLCTGIRKNELNTKNILADIDEEKHILRVKSEKKRNNHDVYREIDITSDLIALVKRNIKSFDTNTDLIYRKFKQILVDNNIKGSLHNLRHTFATNHYYLGTSAKQVQVWLGHETIELTQNIYTHIDKSITKNDILKLYNNLYFQV